MAKIVYGLSGDGSGHSSRTREMASHLVARGHEVKLVSYERGYRNLKDEFDVFETEGLLIASKDNRVAPVKTVTSNLKRLNKGHKKLRKLRQQVFKQFEPDVVITDFEPMTAYLARRRNLPLITLDNQHRMRYVKYKCPPGLKNESRLTKTIIRAIVPKPDVSLVTAFHFGPLKNDRTFLFPPIVRNEVLQLAPRDEGHVLVYVTHGFESLLEQLKLFTRETFLVYGYDKDDRDGNLQFRPFSNDGFLDDLAAAKAIVATAGFTLISEALALRKPYLALPMKGQFEQQLNAFQLEASGYGVNCPEVRREIIGDFFYRLPEFAERLNDFNCDGNRGIKAKLDELLANDCQLAREFHHRRRAKKGKSATPSESESAAV